MFVELFGLFVGCFGWLLCYLLLCNLTLIWCFCVLSLVVSCYFGFCFIYLFWFWLWFWNVTLLTIIVMMFMSGCFVFWWFVLIVDFGCLIWDVLICLLLLYDLVVCFNFVVLVCLVCWLKFVLVCCFACFVVNCWFLGFAAMLCCWFGVVCLVFTLFDFDVFVVADWICLFVVYGCGLITWFLVVCFACFCVLLFCSCFWLIVIGTVCFACFCLSVCLLFVIA